MTEQDNVARIHPVNRPEWVGQLSSAAGRGADFALLLALQLGSGVPATSINSLASADNSDETFPARLNHYRRPPLDCTDVGTEIINQTSTIMHSQSASDARLWQCMHPDPHTLVNDNKKLSADIIANCAFGTQLARKSGAASGIEEDPTQLDDIIKQSEALLAS